MPLLGRRKREKQEAIGSARGSLQAEVVTLSMSV
jgi:hypothetical protein